MGDEQQQQQPAIVNMFEDTLALVGRFSFAVRQPRDAVLGRQGSGKSRLIEALVGRVFLPNIPTRRPLLVHLKRIRDGSDQEYAEFLHIPGRKFYDFNQIRTEIQTESEREAGGGFSDKELHLNIFSPNVLDITFVDLPGIPLGHGIEAERVRTIIMKYINSPASLILAVTAATADLANSNAVQIALTADPDCHRTLGVITKVDLLARGTKDAAAGKPKAKAKTKAKALAFRSKENPTIKAVGKEKVIPLPPSPLGVVNRSQQGIMLNPTIKPAGKGKVIPLPPAPVGVVNRIRQDVSLSQTVEAAGKMKVFFLRYGYVAVVNRSQEDIIQNRTIKDALAAEQDFFRNHPVYNRAADRCGVPHLAKRMDLILVQHSKNYLRLMKLRAIAASGSLAKTAR